ncbi:MAG: cytochrome B [Lewinellaceae bacterium]|nr:cytochrome B [Lewinellaceae bacterium]
MYEGLKHAHSGLRWVVLILLILAITGAYRSWKGGAAGSKMPLYAMISVHVQLLLGLGLYFISPYVKFTEGFMKDPVLRFYSVEHLSLMLLAILTITIGYSRAKRKPTDAARGRTTFMYYAIALVLILLAIPWPFRQGLGAGWF